LSASNQRAAAAALDQARAPVARLDIARDPEDIAADLIEGWTAAQAALRGLIGSTTLSGQALIRELRQRELLSLDQAHALVEFSAAHDRAQRTEYRPTAADIAAAQTGLQQLEAALLYSPPVSRAPLAGASANTIPLADAVAAAPPPGVPLGGTRRRRVPVPLIAGALLLLALIGGAAYYFLAGRGPSALERGVAAYRSGDRTRARNEFAAAARDEPQAAGPHIYLGRMAREEGDIATAARELETAVRLEPQNALAQREMGAHLLAAGNYPLAQKFYERAIRIDPTDRNALGFLGCTLMRQGRFDVGQRFLQRAGQGSWSACANLQPLAPPPQPVR
jgi:tetratricopeptide (TPR) repeat protein